MRENQITITAPGLEFKDWSALVTAWTLEELKTPWDSIRHGGGVGPSPEVSPFHHILSRWNLGSPDTILAMETMGLEGHNPKKSQLLPICTDLT